MCVVLDFVSYRVECTDTTIVESGGRAGRPSPVSRKSRPPSHVLHVLQLADGIFFDFYLEKIVRYMRYEGK